MNPVRHYIILSAAFVVSLQGEVGSPENLEFFEKRIRPVLAEHCYECHSVAANKIKGDLLLDSRSSMLRGGDSGAAIVPGKPEESLLLETVLYANPDLQMPPKNRLSDEVVADLEAWIRMGAPWPDEEEPDPSKVREAFDLEGRKDSHWCWQPLADPVIPQVKDQAWPLGGLDHFILARLEKEGLRPAADADRRTWIRRASFDLRGLPPTTDEVDAFLNDDGPEAFETVVDRYLNSPDYAVKWARHWLDLARYAESYGHEHDYDIPYAWKYRDYVVRAFADDVPHDQMIREALAGDLLESPRQDPAKGLNESIVGTGFWWLGEATHAPTDVRGDEALRIDNQVEVLTKSFLALTVSCARCHDHKFDAISDEDYYSLTGYLQSSRRELAPRDPGGRIAAGVAELRELQQSATAQAKLGSATPSADNGHRVLWDFDQGLPDGWTRSGEAFPEEPTGFSPLQVALLPDQVSSVPGGVWHSGLYGEPLHGVLRSPTFQLEEPELNVLLAARGNVRVKVVIDGYFMNDFSELLFKGVTLKDEAVQTGGGYAWKKLAGDLKKYVGHQVYLEFIDEGDGYLSIDRVSYGKDPKAIVAGVPIDVVALEPVFSQARTIFESLPEPDFVLASRDGTPENDRLHIRGGHRNLGEELPRRFLTALGGEEQPAPSDRSGRRELADQIVSTNNPLTARVQVNRLWHHLTGRGLVRSVDDFGVMGETPSHPELLDWLARRFIEQGWSNRRMIREMVLSRTYRMSCIPDGANAEDVLAERDPSNALLYAFRVRRLPSESIRDSILAVSDRLDPKLEGPSVAVHLTSFMEGRGRPKSGPLDGDGRRSIYTAVRRNFLPPLHLAFDYPVPFSTIGSRARSNVPAQALVLLNDPFVTEQAKLWSDQLLELQGVDARVRRAYQQAFSRDPLPEEIKMVNGFLARQAELHGSGVDDARVWADLCHLLFNKKEFIFLR